MIRYFKQWFGRSATRIRIVQDVLPRQILMTQSCQLGIARCLDQWRVSKHEGICFLLGKTDGETTVCLLAIRPKARTTSGSFNVSALEMAKLVDIATELRLQIVGQVHTHPKKAFHSQGDEDGAHIRFEGFISIVVPNYGAALPEFTGCAVYVSGAEKQWEELPLDAIRIVPSEIIQ
jgi:Prokaryotic homologs of the JAB domain